MLEMWLRTVLGLKYRRCAISAFLSPLAISPRISRSRSVSSGNNWGGVAPRIRPEVLGEARRDRRAEYGFAATYGAHRATTPPSARP